MAMGGNSGANRMDVVMPGLVPGIHVLRRGIGERSDAVLRAAMHGHDDLERSWPSGKGRPAGLAEAIDAANGVTPEAPGTAFFLMAEALPPSSLLLPMFSSAAMRAVVDDGARVQRMLDFVAALARAEAAVGVIPHEAVDPITAATKAERF